MTDRPLLFTLEDLLIATDGVIVHASRKAAAISSVGIDSRTVRAGGLFVALKG